MEAHVFRSRSGAEAEAVRWLETLVGDGEYGWELEAPNTLSCEPFPDFPCRVMAWAVEDSGGFVPSYAFTAGVKHEGRYWQGRVTDENDRPLPPREAISEMKIILGVLIPASQTFLPG